MNKHSFVVGSLLLVAPGILSAREPKLHNPCKDLQIDLDNQVNTLHKRQDDELAQCRQANGKNAPACRELKSQQQIELQRLRDQRQSELSRCSPRLNGSSVRPGGAASCDTPGYQDQDNDRYKHKKHPEPPYPPKTNSPNAHNPKHDGDGNGHRGDPDAGPTRNAGGSGSQHGADHSSGSSSSGGGSGSSTSSHSGSSSGSSSSGSSSSASSSSSNSSSSSSNSSSNSRNSSSGSSSSSPVQSAPAQSAPAPSHPSGGGRPPRQIVAIASSSRSYGLLVPLLSVPLFYTFRVQSEASLEQKPPEPDLRFPYGQDPNQFVDARIPAGKGPHPIVFFIHGGYWRAKYDLTYAGHLCHALKKAGIATWNIEYRRVGNPGSGWPGTFEDVRSAYRALLTHKNDSLAKLDLKRLCVAGHSAGGHLALCLAASEQSVTHVLSLAGVIDLRRAWELHLSNNAAAAFLGGSPTEVPDHYREASPAERSIPQATQKLIHGTADQDVPYEISQSYAAKKKKTGEHVELITLQNIGHFEIVDPGSSIWKQVEETFISLTRR